MKIVLFGAAGRVGGRLWQIAEQRGHKVYPVDKNRDFSTKSDNAQALDVRGDRRYSSACDLEAIEEIEADVVIDFSLPEATREVCDYCRTHRCPLVSGVTGRTEEQQKLVDELRDVVPTSVRSNFSVGVEALTRLVKQACELLAGWDCEIVEIHRRDKKDSPGGTAKNLAAVAAERRNFCNVTVHSLRCGSNFGRHSVIFATQGESLTLTHQAENVDIFARGALLEAEKLVGFAQNVACHDGVGTVDGD